MKSVVISLLILLLCLHSAVAQTILICSDENYWYPFSYVNDDGEAEGLHVDMLTHVLNELGYTYTITPLPWKRCLLETGEGKYDAVLSASYKSARAEFLEYPDAASSNNSTLYLTKVEYVVVTHSENTYTFDGDVKTLPQPVRGVLGYSIVDDLIAKGVDVYKGRNVRDNVELLIRSQRGTVITTPETARALQHELSMGESLKVHGEMLASKAYYLPFSLAKADLSPDLRLKIWEECEKLRDNKPFMDSLYLKYEKKVEAFLDTKAK